MTSSIYTVRLFSSSGEILALLEIRGGRDAAKRAVRSFAKDSKKVARSSRILRAR